MEDIFARLEAAETQAQQEEQQMEAYADNYSDVSSVAEEEDDLFGEREDPELMTAVHREHVAVGPQGRAGTKSKLERAVEAAQLGKEGVYREQLLRPVFRDTFTAYDFSENFGNAMVETVEQQLPKYWQKNPKALALAIILIKKYSDNLGKLEVLAKANGLASSDIYRYYKLVKKYNIN